MAEAQARSCEECQGIRFRASTVPGFVSCRECGKLQPGSIEDLTPRASLIERASRGSSDAERKPGAFAESLGIPDYAEVMVGWRTWTVAGLDVIERGAEPVLASVTYEAVWPPREVVEATCDRGKGRANGVKRTGHEVPEESCSCGLYSAKTREHLLSMPYADYDLDQATYKVLGTVSLWGKVIEGRQGWRSQYGYPREIFVPFEAWALAEPLQATYGVPVRLTNFLTGDET